MVDQELGRLAIEVVNAARRWTLARARCRLVLDSKSASTAEADSVKKTYVRLTDELELTVQRLEAGMRRQGIIVSRGRRRKPFPWKPLISVAAGLSKALEDAVNANNQGAFEGKTVIDGVAEPIDATPPKGE